MCKNVCSTPKVSSQMRILLLSGKTSKKEKKRGNKTTNWKAELGSQLLHHVHGHLRGGAVLSSVAGRAALLAAARVADHVHRVHATIGEILALGEGAGGGRGAQQASLRLLGAGGQARRGGEVVSVEVVGVVQGEGVVRALLHVVVAAAEHVGGGGGGSGGRGRSRARAAPSLHDVLELRGGKRAQLTAVGVHLGSRGGNAAAASAGTGQ